ncbi:MAG: 50S ribosomal protein L9 [Acidobacteriia bacterium]|nr:50S ribosomal protein L9 [Terriglobia bacterium]
MEIILKETIEKLGTQGQVVRVAAGYARNYLFPRKLAIPATPANMKLIDQIKAVALKKEAADRTQAEGLAGLLAQLTVTVARKVGENDVLYGSVTAMDIAEDLKRQGYELDKRKIHLEEPLKTLGEYSVPIKLHHDVTAQVKVQVVAEASAS